MHSLKGKVALVTGGSRGIGRGVAERLGLCGAQVIVNYRNQVEEARAVVAAITDRGGSAHAIQADVSDVAAVDALFAAAVACYQRLDIVVANAGIGIFKPIAETSEADFDRLFAVNAKGVFFCIRAALEHLRPGGRIVCMSTIGTVLNVAGGAAYFGTKGAVEQFCRVAAREAAERAITVNLVSPGFVDTDMLRESAGLGSPDALRDLAALGPLGRLGTPTDIAKAVEFLVSDEAAWITRQNLAVDGGVISR